MTDKEKFPRAQSGRPSRRWWRRAFWLVYALFLLLIVEAAARFYFAEAYHIDFSQAPRQTWKVFYPEEWDARVNDIFFRDADYRILLLGGSVPHEDFGSIGQRLRERLTQATGRFVRVDNMASLGHTTRDSLVKYRHLDGHNYDLVMVYHGINDFRTNNVPLHRFRDDYGHYAWYGLLNSEERTRGNAVTILPFAGRLAWLKWQVAQGKGEFRPTAMPHASLVQYGRDVKSREPFRKNLEAIAALAKERAARTMLMTFAYYQPEDYTHQKFVGKQLDYTLHSVATQLWGAPEYVIAGIEQHNDVVRGLAAELGGTLFVDQEALIADGAVNFNDVCHLTEQGCAAGVENVLGPIVAEMRAKGLAVEPRPGAVAQ